MASVDPHAQGMGTRRFGRVNWLGLQTLTIREIRRFTTVWAQTLMAPVITAALFMTVFTLALGANRGEVHGVPYAQFMAPGILMMSVIQNAFANSSSSLVIAKVQGNIVDTLMPPLSAAELVAGYTIGAVARGVIVAVVIALIVFPFVGLVPSHPIWAILFILLGATMMALLGLLGGIFASKFDQMAAITNFVITPLSFLSGTFYSINILPEPFRTISHLNPFFYVIDGARYGFIGQSDANPWLGLVFVTLICAALATLAWRWMKRGYRLKS
ncbi:ABC transporter permease [Paracoccaceae bacterium GXU_MW_L88]